MQSDSSRVKGLVFGGLMAALVVVFALVPVLSLFLPIPLVLAYVRFGGRVAGLTAVVAILFSAMFVGPLQAFFLLVPAGVLPGLAFGYGFHRKLRPLTIGVIALFVFMIGWGAQYVVTRAVVLQGRDPIAMGLESEQGKAMLEQMIDFMEKVASPAPGTEKQASDQAQLWVSEMRKDPARMMWTLLPSALFLLGAVSTWINYMLCRFILPRFKHEVPAPTPFGQFRLPGWLTILFTVASFGGGFMPQSSLLEAPWWVQLWINVLPPLQLIFVLAGIAVAYGYLVQKEVSKPFAIIFSLTGFLLGQIGVLVYVMLAMWDSIFDFRKLGHGMLKRLNPEEHS